MSTHQKRQALILITVIGIAFILLAASLQEMQLSPGLPFPIEEKGPHSQTTTSDFEESVRSAPMPWIQGLLAFIFVSLLIYLGINLVKEIKFQQVRRVFVFLLVLLVLLVILPFVTPSQPSAVYIEPASTAASSSFTFTGAPLGAPPMYLVWSVIICLLLCTAAVGVWLFQKAFRWNTGNETLLREAELAVEAIESGQPLKDVIIRCYMQMQKDAKEQQGIERRADMTPGEFERLLTGRGLPAVPVSQLTRLFEEVRYGHTPVAQQQEQTAILCLNTIARYCRGER